MDIKHIHHIYPHYPFLLITYKIKTNTIGFLLKYLRSLNETCGLFANSRAKTERKLKQI
jgi:hypothetical protein